MGTDEFAGRAESGESLEDVDVDLSGVGLRGYRVGVVESRELGDQFIELFDFIVVSFEDGEEGGLRPRRAFDAAEPEIVSCAREVSEIPEEVLDP